MFLAIGLIAGIASAADINTNILAYWPLDADAKDIVGSRRLIETQRMLPQISRLL